MENKTEKRKPGRPRTTPVKKPLEKMGIIDKPTVANNLIELMYDSPDDIKKIASYGKSLNSERITFMFFKDKAMIYTNNHRETNDVEIVFDGSKMVQYYCEEPKEINVLFVNINTVFQKLDKTYDSVSFVIEKESQNRYLNIKLMNDFNIPEYFEVDVIMDNKSNVTPFRERLLALPPPSLEFKLNGRHFKKMIADTKNFHNEWSIEKFGASGNFVFSYKSVNNQVRCTIVPSDLDDISFISRIEENEQFSVSVYVNNMKPTSSNKLGSVINISAWKNKPIFISTTVPSGAITFNVFIKIVDLMSGDSMSKLSI
jgi:hypothetical protein